LVVQDGVEGHCTYGSSLKVQGEIRRLVPVDLGSLPQLGKEIVREPYSSAECFIRLVPNADDLGGTCSPTRGL